MGVIILVTIKSKREIELMKEACRVAALAQKEIEKAIRPGISTYELDKIAEDTMRKNGAIPAEKGYPSGVKGVPDFPGSICASVNDEVIHGIPSKRAILKDGDIITKIDNEKITTTAEFKYYLYKHKIGDTVKVTYIRNGKEGNCEVKLTKESK